MLFDLPMIEQFYNELPAKISEAKKMLGRPMTLSEKILYAHLSNEAERKNYERGASYALFAPNRVAMQDATAQMALLQFINAGKDKAAVPSTVHCDHLIQANVGAKADLEVALKQNEEVYGFLKNVAAKYGIGFWKPGAGIIHQVLLENYAFPGGMMVGTDSHTVNAGGLGMVAIGVGGADAVDVMVGLPWELKMPKLIGIKLTGKLNGWASPKDIILKVAGMLTVKGGTGCIVEYFGEGADSLSCTGKGTICNMGAEIGATTSIFAFDKKMYDYLVATGREQIAKMAMANKENLASDAEVYANPEKYYDQLIEIDLATVEPYINGPFTPDAATPISQFADYIKKNNYPETLEVGLIGSCTNSSYEDLDRAASVAKFAVANNIKVKAEFIVSPGSEQVRKTTERDGQLDAFKAIGGVMMTNACGPCIGQWNRHTDNPTAKNSIIHSFNRNFAKRTDGNPNTCGFVASPEMVTAMAISGSMLFNPLTDKLKTEDGREIMLQAPNGNELPTEGFLTDPNGYQEPPVDGSSIEIKVDPNSERLQLLEPFKPWDGADFTNVHLLIKAKGKCTTDHISMAGKWLRYRGHLDNISNNLLIGAINAFNETANSVLNPMDGNYIPVPDLARTYKAAGIKSIIIGDENYGEGSSREHAAMEPRHLGAYAVLAKSFARIHETNLKKQGMLALTFANKDDYNKIKENDTFDIIGLTTFAENTPLQMVIKHADGSQDQITLNHTYNNAQIEWFKLGGALNLIRKQSKK
ncbi:MAG: aconitate hydratase [Salinivirgaceae bacterium]|nr:aconitate hydratase [Salinivirgaceae bacterium]